MIFSVLVKTAMDEPYESFVEKINLMFNKQLDELIGEENIDILKEHIEGELFPRYDYLNVFKNNRAVINENYFKFIDDDKKNPKYKNKTEFTKWIHSDIRKVMEGKNITPSIIYGDSILGNEVLTLLNDKNDIEFHRIDKLCDKWESYDNFKTDEYNEYFTNILNKLFKDKTDSNNSILMNETDYINGKIMGSIYTNNIRKNHEVSIGALGKIDGKRTKKQFYFSMYGNDTKALHEALKYRLKLNEELDLIKNKYRYMIDLDSNRYIEVQVNNNKIMLCDIDDIDIIEKYTWCINEKNYVVSNNVNSESWQYHKLVLNKILNKLPNNIRNQIKDLTVDHMNRNTLDNRKQNLRLVNSKEQQWNQDIFKTNTSGTRGVYYRTNRKAWIANWLNLDGKRESKYFKNKQDAINERKTQEQIMETYFNDERKKLIDKLKQLLINDQKDRYDKEQSSANYKVWTDKGWSNINRVIRHKTYKRIFRIVTKTSIIDVTEDHSLIDKNGNYITPKTCTIGTELMYGINNFDTIEFVDIKSNKYDILAFSSDDKVECMRYYCYNKKLGYNILIDVNNDKFVLHRTNDVIENPNKIINIQQLNDVVDDYVYDLETEVGHFHAGIGEIIVKNTDSVFIKYNIKLNGEEETLKDKVALETSIKLGQLTSKLLFTILPLPQNMLYEKTFHPYVILSKKRYVGNKYGSDPNKYYQDAMGITLKRRDNAPIVKIVVGGIVRSILNDKSPEKAVAFAKETLKKILCNKYPMDKFIITKTLKGNALIESERILEEMKPKEERTYSDRTRIVHAVLADRMADRDPGNKPLSNDRIPYAYIITKGNVELQGDRVEHPDYIIENKLPLDYLFYLTNQIMKPSLQFLEHITDNPDKIFETCIMKELNRREGKRPLTYYFNLLEEMKQNKDDVFGEDNEDDDDNDNDNDNDTDNDNEENKYESKFTFNFDLDDEISDQEEDSDTPKLGKKKIVKNKSTKNQANVPAKNQTKKRVLNHKPVYDENKGGFVVTL